MKYILGDGELSHSENPKTFWIPSLQERKSLNLGDYAKLIFINLNSDFPSERIWVLITKIVVNGYEGILSNDPLFNENINNGDLIIFEYKHIINIILKN